MINPFELQIGKTQIALHTSPTAPCFLPSEIEIATSNVNAMADLDEQVVGRGSPFLNHCDVGNVRTRCLALTGPALP